MSSRSVSDNDNRKKGAHGQKSMLLNSVVGFKENRRRGRESNFCPPTKKRQPAWGMHVRGHPRTKGKGGGKKKKREKALRI